LEQVNQKV